MPKTFEEITEKTVHEHNGVEYHKVSKTEGFTHPEAERFDLSGNTYYFLPTEPWEQLQRDKAAKQAAKEAAAQQPEMANA